MSLNIDPIYEDMVRQFQSQTTNDRFRSDFVSSVNKSLDDLLIAGQLSTAISHIAQPTGTIDDLDADDLAILSAGCTFYLIISGREHVLKDKSYAVAKDEWIEKKGDFWVKQLNELQDEVADDLTGEDESVIGLGDVTDW